MRCRGKVVGILDGQGHLAMKAAPKWFAREIVGFLEEHDITRRSDTQGSHQDKPGDDTPRYHSNRSSWRLRRLSGGGTRLSPEVRSRLPERVVIDAADHISSFSDFEMKSK